MIKNGARFTVSMAQAFPAGCCLVPDSIAEAQDYDERTRTRSPSVDKVTGKRVFQVRVSVTWTPSWRAAPARSWSRSWPTGRPSRRLGRTSSRWSSRT